VKTGAVLHEQGDAEEASHWLKQSLKLQGSHLKNCQSELNQRLSILSKEKGVLTGLSKQLNEGTIAAHSIQENAGHQLSVELLRERYIPCRESKESKENLICSIAVAPTTRSAMEMERQRDLKERITKATALVEESSKEKRVLVIRLARAYRAVALTHRLLGDALRATKKFDEAEDEYQESLRMFRTPVEEEATTEA